MKLTIEQAYMAMFDFLDSYWKRTGKSEDIGELLDFMSLTEDINHTTSSADTTMLQDWLNSVDKVKNNIPINIKFKLHK